MRDGNAPNMARWLADGTHRLSEWETDLSSQTGASQAGILLGSNEDIAAFRWVEKETATMMTCSAPQDCAEIMVGSFYDPELDEGCAFEELICFHGGIGGLQTRPFILHPPASRPPPGPSSAPRACTGSSPDGARRFTDSRTARRRRSSRRRWPEPPKHRSETPDSATPGCSSGFRPRLIQSV